MNRRANILPIALALMAGTAPAEPLYPQRYEAARPTAEAVAKSLEQVRAHRDIQIRDQLKVPPFHQRVERPVTEGETFCQNCHLPVPHTQKLRTRAFLNMHSRYIACETCHFRPEDVSFEYAWLDYGNGQPTRPEQPFRTGRQIDNSTVLNGRIKIVPFYQRQPVIALRDSPFAVDIARQWQAADEAGKAGLRARLHAPLKKEGPACGQCHAEQQPMLDFAGLGAAPDQALAIQRHVIPQFFGRYQEDDERLKIIDILR